MKVEERGSSGGGTAPADGGGGADAGADVGMLGDGGLSGVPVVSWRTAVELQFVDVPLPLTPIGQAQQQLLLQQQQQQSGADGGGSGSGSGDGSGGAVVEDSNQETAEGAVEAAEAAGGSKSPAAVAAVGAATTAATGADAVGSSGGDAATGTEYGPVPVLVQAVQCDDSSTCQVLLPTNLHSALQQLGLSTAVGVIRLMRASSKLITKSRPSRTSSSGGTLDRRVSVASASGDDEGDFGEWLVIRILLGVPLSPLPLCRQVCQNLRDAGCLSPAGQVQQKAGQQQLQQHLLRLVSQYGAAGLMNGSGAGIKLGAGSAAAGGAQSGSRGNGSSKPPGPAHEQLAVMGTLPAVNILFDGVQLQPAELQLQGTSNAAYNLWWSP